MKWRFDNATDTFSLDVGDFLSGRQIDINDITEVLYMVKVNAQDADIDALVSLTIGSGVTKVPAAGTDPDKFAIQFSNADFDAGKLDVTTCTKDDYFAGAGIKLAGWTRFLEMEFDDNRLEITPDFIHD